MKPNPCNRFLKDLKNTPVPLPPNTEYFERDVFRKIEARTPVAGRLTISASMAAAILLAFIGWNHSNRNGGMAEPTALFRIGTASATVQPENHPEKRKIPALYEAWLASEKTRAYIQRKMGIHYRSENPAGREPSRHNPNRQPF